MIRSYARGAARPGPKTKRDTINRALTIAAAISADDRARALRWLQDNAHDFLDFDVLEDRERQGL
ncbi:DUF2191 domain-containing protein [Streptomyces sp. NPDC012508]|uniref:DUF2191 domain-containing protein n=1 Tax=Streptomyces sp. NPDC012508 TaxID=3364837 RepID=UPI0036CCD574